MDPSNPDSFNHYQAILSTGRTYHYIDQRPSNYNASNTTLLCIHGFPDLWYGWKNQIAPWVNQGYRVIVPDMLGYGKTDMPLDAAAYSMKRLCDDLAALLHVLGIGKAVVIGHDWGAYTAGRFALWYPDRLLGLVMLSVPYTPPLTTYRSLEELVQLYPSFGYQLYFASEASAPEIEHNLESFFRLIFRSPGDGSSWSRKGELQQLVLSGYRPGSYILDDKDLSYYISNFKRGMTGALSYYRTTKYRFEEEQAASLPSRLHPDLPVLFMFGTKDVTCPPSVVSNLPTLVDKLKVVPMPGVGHWVMLQAPDSVTTEVLVWLEAVGLGHRSGAHL
ncbi:alpha beta-hydrolase [Phlebopus sp. FC_14]|nr:alpha beta-hydrolase [Phlebopus sp. FC_14]